MKSDSRLSSVLHVLLHLIHSDRPLTSEALAGYLGTHPVVVRRTLAGLRRLGYVDSAKGHGGGWVVRCDPAAVTLRDIYAAVGAPPLLAIGHRTADPVCLVEQAVNAALEDAFQAAEAVVNGRLGSITLAALAADFGQRLAAHPRSTAFHEH